MGKKADSSNLWSSIIGIFGLIIGATGGYLGTRLNTVAQIQAAQESAKAQITAAAINVYGPIHATQTVEARITPAMTPAAPNKSDILAMEQIPQDIFAYAGNNNPDGGVGTFVLINNDENIPNYKLDYSLPFDKYGYAGLAFNFHGSMNLSTYNAIKCIIIFNQPLDAINLYIKDIGNNFNTIRVVSNGAGEMELRYEFNNFPGINFNAVKEVGLVASTDFSTGTHQAVIKNIRFVK